jgi:hypothetical protein
MPNPTPPPPSCSTLPLVFSPYLPQNSLFTLHKPYISSPNFIPSIRLLDHSAVTFELPLHQSGVPSLLLYFHATDKKIFFVIIAEAVAVMVFSSK